jgi:TPP-dependent pyruvate/acetoin dehydrogenase alpha subunit
VPLTRECFLGMPNTTCKICPIDETVGGLCARGLAWDSPLLSICQGASPIGSISSLADDDHILSAQRAHYQSVDRGADINLRAPELLGNATYLRTPFTSLVPTVSHTVAVS